MTATATEVAIDKIPVTISGSPTAALRSPQWAISQAHRPRLADVFLLLYTGARADVKRVVAAFYAPSATFQDPFVRTRGRDDVAAHFSMLKAVFDGASAYSVTISEEPGRIVLRCTLVYRLFRLGGTLHIAQTSTLLLDAAGMVCAHLDEWHHPLGLLASLPWPLSAPYDAWRLACGRVTSVLARVIWSWVDALLAFCICVMRHLCSFMDSFIAGCLRTPISLFGVLGSLLDLRGAGLLGGCATALPEQSRSPSPSSCSASPAKTTGFLAGLRGAVAVVVGDFSEVSTEVASQLARAGASSLHLVGPSDSRLEEVAAKLNSNASDCSVETSGLDFTLPAEVEEWCEAMGELLRSQEKQVDVLVLCSVAVTPKEHRFTRDALDQAFAADVVGLHGLLRGLRPVLSPGARVVVTASATCNWLSRPSHDALCAGNAADALGALLARSQQQAARVVVAGHQARLWAAEADGPICVSCTPTGCWSAWTDLLAWVGMLDSLKSHIGSNWCACRLMARLRAAVIARIAGAVVQLCSRSSFLAAGDYYWGCWRSGNVYSSVGNMAEDDIGNMFFALALRSEQLPG
jgi:NAD(P)-dependent dehydrogenase (short-subunit alcohol dehydrogenase family)